MKYLINCILLFLFSFSIAEAPSPPKEFIIYMPAEKGIPRMEINDRINDLSVLHPTFRNKVVMLLYEAKKAGIELEVVETYRHPDRQDMLRRKGRSMLHGGRSKHQHYLAVDVVPVKYGWFLWHDKELWAKIGKIGKKQGLIWGGDWKRFRDYPHFEYPIHLDSLHTLTIPDTVLIPLNL
jgi:peptidoglycan L-alanyl-D-glutamate endopeptidase CwlK